MPAVLLSMHPVVMSTLVGVLVVVSSHGGAVPLHASCHLDHGTLHSHASLTYIPEVTTCTLKWTIPCILVWAIPVHHVHMPPPGDDIQPILSPAGAAGGVHAEQEETRPRLANLGDEAWWSLEYQYPLLLFYIAIICHCTVMVGSLILTGQVFSPWGC